MSNENGLDYSSSGVDIDAETNAVAALIGTLGASTRKKGEGGSCDLRKRIWRTVGIRRQVASNGNRWVGSKLQIANTSVDTKELV